MKLSIFLPAFFLAAGIHAAEQKPEANVLAAKQKPEKVVSVVAEQKPEEAVAVAEQAVEEVVPVGEPVADVKDIVAPQELTPEDIKWLEQEFGGSFVLINKVEKELQQSMLQLALVEQGQMQVANAGAQNQVARRNVFEMLGSFAANSVYALQTTTETALWFLDLALTTAEATVDVMKKTNDHLEVQKARAANVAEGFDTQYARGIVTAFEAYECAVKMGMGKNYTGMVIDTLQKWSTPGAMAKVYETLGDERSLVLQQFIAQNNVLLLEYHQ